MSPRHGPACGVDVCLECWLEGILPLPAPASPHLFEPPQVVVSPRRQMDVPDRPGAPSSDFEGCVS